MRETLTLRIRGVSHRFADVPHERCPSCGERIFGVDASRMFDDALAKHRKSHAA